MRRFRFGIFGILLTGFVCFAAPACAEAAYVAADLLNVRTAPSLDSAITEVLEWGEPLTITYGPTMGWYEIYRNGGCYYVRAEYVGGGDSSDGYGGSDSYENASYDSYENVSYDSQAAEDTDSGDYSAASDYGYEQQSQEYLGNFVITAYCSCSRCTSGSGITASGSAPVAGRTVAMGGVPFGTKLLINGTVYTVEDRGTSYGHVDIYFNSHQDAVNFGTQYADVYQIY